MTSNIWLNMQWTDPYMKWNSSEYNNIKVAAELGPAATQDIRISPDRLWKPDILLYNSASANFYAAYQRCSLAPSPRPAPWWCRMTAPSARSRPASSSQPARST
jgi:hypothetical protein